MNPPFPYQVKSTRETDSQSSNPFADNTDIPEVIYEGECDYKMNTRPLVKDGVTIGRYKLYIPDTDIEFAIDDIIEFRMQTKISKGKVIDFSVFNLGTTILWDKQGK